MSTWQGTWPATWEAVVGRLHEGNLAGCYKRKAGGLGGEGGVTYPPPIQTKTKINKNKREVCMRKKGEEPNRKRGRRGAWKCSKKERKEEKKKRKWRNQYR